uniref:Uncharacterized protein n=1 Tax=Cannabis sativa TaxID=3483 RepID=A0A803Q575_CANSA
MGCGESKHDVATGNTILQRKKSDNSIKTTSINAKDIETVHENPPINAAVDQVGRDSPNRFFSSRKDEELGIDMIISDGQSGKSEYNTPRHGAVTQAVADDEKENEKPVNVEENSVKEVETIKVEEKDLKLVEEVKSTNQNDEEV